MKQGYLGGGIPDAAKFAYVSRGFEGDCFSHLTAGSWVLLLGPRQHGKTSGLVRVAHRLKESGVECAYVDLQRFGARQCTYEAFLAWLARAASSAFGVQAPVAPAYTDDVESWLAASVPADSGSVALILDEAAAVPEEHRNRFFSQMRALYNSRAVLGDAGAFGGLVVAFSGTFDPDDLITGDNSPFNICQRVDTSDFTLNESENLAVDILGPGSPPGVAAKVYELVGGQPFLTQAAFQLIETSAGVTIEEVLQDFKDRCMVGGYNNHLPRLLGQFATDPTAMSTLRQLAGGDEFLRFSALDRVQARLRVVGICRVVGQHLRIRNSLYQDFVLSIPEGPASPSTAVSTVLRLEAMNFATVRETALRRLAVEAYGAGVDLIGTGSWRMALAAFGSCLESIFLDFASRLSGADLTTAREAVRSVDTRNRMPEANPRSWSFAQLITGVSAVCALPAATSADTVRGWRNLIHPSVAMRTPSPSDGYEAEARIAATWIQAVLRDLP